MPVRFILLLFWVAMGLLSAPASSQAPSGAADLVLHNGKILTVDPEFRVVEAVAIRQGRIQAVGGNRAILDLAGPETQRIDLEGKTVVPGLIDTHSHVQSYAERNYGGSLRADQTKVYPVNFRVVKSMEDVVRQIQQTLAAVSPAPGEWIHFSSNGLGKVEQIKILYDQLDRAALDRAAPRNPIVLSMGIPIENGYLVNGRALDLLWESYGDFIQHYGRFWVDAEGRPDGHLEPPASRLVMNYFRPRPSPEDLAPVFNKTLEEWAAMGITTVSTKLHPEAVEAYRSLEAAGRLKVRIGYGADWLFGVPGLDETFQTLRMGQGSDRVWMVSVTPVGLDGSGARQCTALERNSRAAGDQGTMGISLLGAWYPQGQCHLDPEYRGATGRGGAIRGNYYRDWLFQVAEHGHRVANMHVAGDRAQSLYLDALEQIDRQKPGSVRNWALDHCTLVNPEDISRAARMGVVWSCAPKYISSYETIARSYGDAIARSHLVPIRSMVDAGIHVAFEMDQDSYVWDDLALLITRKVDGTVLGPDQRIDRITALKTITRWAAEYVLRGEDLGSLEVGKWADLVVLDRDYLKVAEEELPGIRSLMTLLGGDPVFLDPEFARTVGIPPKGAIIATYQSLKTR